MTPKERIDKRAREMNATIIREMRHLESKISLLEIWILIARKHGISEADARMQENLNWTPNDKTPDKAKRRSFKRISIETR